MWLVYRCAYDLEYVSVADTCLLKPIPRSIKGDSKGNNIVSSVYCKRLLGNLIHPALRYI